MFEFADANATTTSTLPTTTRMVLSLPSRGVGSAPAFVFRQEMQIRYPRITNHGRGLPPKKFIIVLAELSINVCFVHSSISRVFLVEMEALA